MKAFGAFLMVLGVSFVISGCTDSKTAIKALQGAGYSKIELTGYSWFSCSKDDTYSTGFKAVGPTGVQVEGSVCSGLLFKNATIRLN